MTGKVSAESEPAIWFPTIKAGTGADVFTQRLCEELNVRGIRSELTWLPLRAEYLPWTVRCPQPPVWANVVHVNTWLHRCFVPARIPVVATMHHSVHDSALSPYKSLAQDFYHRFWIKPMERWILQRAECLTVVSHYTACKVIEAFDSRNFQVIHNGVDIGIFCQGPKREFHRPFRLLYVGTWSRRKGTELLGPIMTALGNQFELEYTSSPHDSEATAGLPSNCKSIGKPDLAGLVAAYQRNDALLFPSRLEGFGQVAAEAMACGLPVVAAETSALPELIEAEKTGYLVRADDVESFVAAVSRLSGSVDGWATMSNNARKRAVDHFDIADMVDRYISIYREVISHQSGASL